MPQVKLRLWWIPQIPGKPFRVDVESVEQAKFLYKTLAAYDAFQLEHRIKGDYSNVGGLERWDEEDRCWYEWDDDDGNNLPDVIREET